VRRAGISGLLWPPRLGVSRGARSRPPEEMDHRHGPGAAIMFDAEAQARGLAMRQLIPAEHVHGRRMHPGEPSHLHDDPAGPSHPIDPPVPRGHPAA
jgi:hypothetical protein